MSDSCAELNDIINYNIYKKGDLTGCFCAHSSENRNEYLKKSINDKAEMFSNNCFCVNRFIIDFTCRFFTDFQYKSTSCLCNIFWSQGCRLCGYSFFEALDRKDLPRELSMIRREMVNVVHLDLNEFTHKSVILLCMIFENLMQDYKDQIFTHKNAAYLRSKYDEIQVSYNKLQINTTPTSWLRNELDQQNILRVYFYICFFLRGKATFDDNKIMELFQRKIKNNKSLAIEICKEMYCFIINFKQHSGDTGWYSIIEGNTISSFQTRGLNFTSIIVYCVLKRIIYFDDINDRNPIINHGMILEHINKNQLDMASYTDDETSPLYVLLNNMCRIVGVTLNDIKTALI